MLKRHEPGVGVILPAVRQVESDAPANVVSKAQISNGTQADVEEGDDAHPQIQHGDEGLRPLHLVLQRKNLPTQRDKDGAVNRTLALSDGSESKDLKILQALCLKTTLRL